LFTLISKERNIIDFGFKNLYDSQSLSKSIMKILPLFLMLFFVTFIAMAQEKLNPRDLPATNTNPTTNTNSSVDSTLQTALGTELSSLLQGAESVKAYYLDGKTTDATTNGFQGFKVLETKNLTAAQLKTIKELVLDKNTYLLDQYAKRCDFEPELGFVFKKGNKTTTLAIATNCDLLRFKGLKDFFEDCDPAHNKFQTLGKNIFPARYNQTTAQNSTTTTNENTLLAQNNLQARGTYHIVEKGESLYGISSKYGLKITELIKLNQFKDEKEVIHEGDKVLIKAQ
jgi:LysM repeat protein